MGKSIFIVKDENGKIIKEFSCKNIDSVGTWTRNEYFRKGFGKKVYIYDKNDNTLQVTAEILEKKVFYKRRKIKRNFVEGLEAEEKQVEELSKAEILKLNKMKI